MKIFKQIEQRPMVPPIRSFSQTCGTYQTVGCPIKLSDSPVQLSRPPQLGEHADALLGTLCGVASDEVKRLREDGVV